MSTCSQLGGHLAEPKDQSSLLQLFENVNQKDFALSCSTQTFWVGIQRSVNNKSVWETITNQSKTYLPWSQGEPNGEITGENCVGAFLSTEKYHDIKCEEKKCFSCQFQREVLFELKGLCSEQELIDTDYIFLTDQILNGHLIFQGILGKTLIEFNKTSRLWNMRSQSRDENLGFMNGFGYLDTPVGKKNWYLYVNCRAEITNNIKLKLTKVNCLKQNLMTLSQSLQ